MTRLWNRIATVFSIGLFSDHKGAGELSRRWNREGRRDPALMADLINMGGVLQLTDVEKLDATQRLAYEAGRRDLALQLLAMAKLDHTELNNLLGDDDA